MNSQLILEELKALGTERTKKTYIRQGAQEPLYGVATGAMKPLAKKYKNNQELAEELYQTGNYDAMYLAGMIADPSIMTEADFNRWMESAYFQMISDYIVAVTLAETDIAQTVSDNWIATGKDLYMSAGYNCYCWIIGNRKDEEFDSEKLGSMIETVQKTIHEMPKYTKAAMNSFIAAVGISYIPLHEKALSAAEAIEKAEVSQAKMKGGLTPALEQIQKAVDKGKIGFKRRNVRC
jgi:3-methyladenine DNA glycosylase AlkD